MERRSPIRLAVAVVGTFALTVVLPACSPAETSNSGSAAQTVTVTATATLNDAATATVTAPSTITVTETTTPPAVTNTKTVTITEDPEPAESEPDADSSPSGLKIGGPGVTASDTDGAATVEVLSVKRKKKALGEYGDPPTKGNFVLFDIVYTGTQGTFTYNPFDWTVRDPDGRAYDQDSAFGFDGQLLDSGTLTEGSKARGYVIFDAPKGPLTLEYSPGLMGAPATWIVPG